MFVPRASEVVTNVYQVSLPGTSVFMLLDDEVTIVDSGWRGTGRSVLESLARLGRHPSEVSNIVVTHHHSDHLGDAAYLSERCSARVAVHRDEAPFVQGDVTPPSPFTNRVLGRLISPLVASRKPRPVAVDLTLEDGDVLDGMRVVHSPGHTPGSISVHLPHRGLLMVGDALEHRRGRLGTAIQPLHRGHGAGQAVDPKAGGAGLRRALLQPFSADPRQGGANPAEIQ